MSPLSIYADLHLHTVASDGELTPEELVDEAAEAGLGALAITDHDSIGSVAAAMAYAPKVGLEVVPGCELTMYDGPVEFHLLALFIDPSPDGPFQNFLDGLQRTRKARALEMVQKLRAVGLDLEDQDVLDAAGKSDSIGKPHVAHALVKRGYARSLNDALVRFLGQGRPGHVSKHRLSPEAAFQAVHAAGGLAILAHPGRDPHDGLIAGLFRRGMDGIEALYRSHSPALRQFYAGLARRYERAISGGSDFHGPVLTPHIQVGEAGVDRYLFEALRRQAQRYKNSASEAPATHA